MAAQESDLKKKAQAFADKYPKQASRPALALAYMCGAEEGEKVQKNADKARLRDWLKHNTLWDDDAISFVCKCLD